MTFVAVYNKAQYLGFLYENWYGNSEVRNSMHHHTIQINQLTKCNIFTSLLLKVYVWLDMFRAPLRPSLRACCCAVVRSWWWEERGPKHVEPHINVK
jgi:hypothetical protein